MGTKHDPDRSLTPRQQRFVEVYNGNAMEAARIAGFAHAHTQGTRLLANVRVARAIQERRSAEAKPHIATRQERQKFWTDVMKDPKAPLRERLKAAELLGRSEADFTDKVLVGDLEKELRDMPDDVLLARLEQIRSAQGGASTVH